MKLKYAFGGTEMGENPATYFKNYRHLLGFQNQQSAKNFLAAKDIMAGVDYEYVERMNSRVEDIIKMVNKAIHPSLCRSNIVNFCQDYIAKPYSIIKEAGLLPRLNNQGRRPEEVLFSWLRGYAVSEYFSPAISTLFSVDLGSVFQIGQDDLKNIDTFRRAPTADLELRKKDKKLRIEVQSGFQDVNDIKEHKVREAKNVFRDTGVRTVAIHFDLFNGQVALVQLDNIQDTDVNWVTRQQMEGQTVFSINQNYFVWRLLDPLPAFEEIGIEW
jgi:hypothetical protein